MTHLSFFCNNDACNGMEIFDSYNLLLFALRLDNLTTRVCFQMMSSKRLKKILFVSFGHSNQHLSTNFQLDNHLICAASILALSLWFSIFKNICLKKDQRCKHLPSQSCHQISML